MDKIELTVKSIPVSLFFRIPEELTEEQEEKLVSSFEEIFGKYDPHFEKEERPYISYLVKNRKKFEKTYPLEEAVAILEALRENENIEFQIKD